MRPLLIALLTFSALAAGQQPGVSVSPVAGHWLGTLHVGIPSRATFSIAETNGKLTGTMASLDQGGAKIPLNDVRESA